MATRQLSVQRLTVTSSKPFETVVAALEGAVGHPNMADLQKAIGEAKTYGEMEGVIQKGLGRTGLMEFMRFDMGAVLRKGHGLDGPKSVRFLIGNPLIMREMAKHIPDACSYAPVTILIDERADGVNLSYDKMASFLAPYDSPETLKVAEDLDSKIEKLLREAASQ